MAGLQIVIPGADFSGSGIPKNTRYISGTELPSAGALGLFTLEDGTVGQRHTGDFHNSVPGAIPGRVFRGWTAPRMSNFGTARGGISVDDINGALIDTRISAARSQFTVAMVIRTPSKRSAVNPYNIINVLTSDSVNAIPATNAGSIQLLSTTALWGLGVHLQTGQNGPFMRYGAPLSTSGTNTVMAESLGVKDKWNAIALSVDGPAGFARAQSLLDYREVSDAGRGNTLIKTAFVDDLDQRDGNFIIGATPNGAGRDSAGTLADIMCAAVYSTSHSGSGLDAILRGLAKIAQQRGVTVEGY